MESLFILGQVVLGAYFVLAGVEHFTRSKDMITYATFKGLPMPAAAVYASGFVLVLGGIGIFTQMMLVSSYIGLSIFLIVAACTMHAFWKQKEAQAKMMDAIQFKKNIALAAALLMLVAPLL